MEMLEHPCLVSRSQQQHLVTRLLKCRGVLQTTLQILVYLQSRDLPVPDSHPHNKQNKHRRFPSLIGQCFEEGPYEGEGNLHMAVAQKRGLDFLLKRDARPPLNGMLTLSRAHGPFFHKETAPIYVGETPLQLAIAFDDADAVRKICRAHGGNRAVVRHKCVTEGHNLFHFCCVFAKANENCGNVFKALVETVHRDFSEEMWREPDQNGLIPLALAAKMSPPQFFDIMCKVFLMKTEWKWGAIQSQIYDLELVDPLLDESYEYFHREDVLEGADGIPEVDASRDSSSSIDELGASKSSPARRNLSRGLSRMTSWADVSTQKNEKSGRARYLAKESTFFRRLVYGDSTLIDSANASKLAAQCAAKGSMPVIMGPGVRKLQAAVRKVHMSRAAVSQLQSATRRAGQVVAANLDSLTDKMQSLVEGCRNTAKILLTTAQQDADDFLLSEDGSGSDRDGSDIDTDSSDADGFAALQGTAGALSMVRSKSKKKKRQSAYAALKECDGIDDGSDGSGSSGGSGEFSGIGVTGGLAQFKKTIITEGKSKKIPPGMKKKMRGLASPWRMILEHERMDLITDNSLLGIMLDRKEAVYAGSDLQRVVRIDMLYVVVVTIFMLSHFSGNGYPGKFAGESAGEQARRAAEVLAALGKSSSDKLGGAGSTEAAAPSTEDAAAGLGAGLGADRAAGSGGGGSGNAGGKSPRSRPDTPAGSGPLRTTDGSRASDAAHPVGSGQPRWCWCIQSCCCCCCFHMCQEPVNAATACAGNAVEDCLDPGGVADRVKAGVFSQLPTREKTLLSVSRYIPGSAGGHDAGPCVEGSVRVCYAVAFGVFIVLGGVLSFLRAVVCEIGCGLVEAVLYDPCVCFWNCCVPSASTVSLTLARLRWLCFDPVRMLSGLAFLAMLGIKYKTFRDEFRFMPLMLGYIRLKKLITFCQLCASFTIVFLYPFAIGDTLSRHYEFGILARLDKEATRMVEAGEITLSEGSVPSGPGAGPASDEGPPSRQGQAEFSARTEAIKYIILERSSGRLNSWVPGSIRAIPRSCWIG